MVVLVVLSVGEGDGEMRWGGCTFGALIGVDGKDEDAFRQRVRHVRHDAEDIPVEAHFPLPYVCSCLLESDLVVYRGAAALVRPVTAWVVVTRLIMKL